MTLTTRFETLGAFMHGPGFAPFSGGRRCSYPWHRAWVEYRRFNRLDGVALNDIGLSFADRASVTVEVIFSRIQSGR